MLLQQSFGRVISKSEYNFKIYLIHFVLKFKTPAPFPNQYSKEVTVHYVTFCETEQLLASTCTCFVQH